MSLSPLKINILLHIYAIAEPIPRVESLAAQSALFEFQKMELIERTDDKFSGYRLLPRGQKLVEMLLNTPYPVEVKSWKDPRSE